MRKYLHNRISLNRASDLHKIGCSLPIKFSSMDLVLHNTCSIWNFNTFLTPGLAAYLLILCGSAVFCLIVSRKNGHTRLPELLSFGRAGPQGGRLWSSEQGRNIFFKKAMMADVFSWHRQFFRVLGKNGATFDPPFFGKTVSECEFHCACGRQFDTAQGLSTHRRKAHGIFSQEHDLLNGATCPVCMVHFWTTQRLQQHLSYISRRTGRNACYQVLRKSGYAVDYERVHFPHELEG